MGRNIRNHNRQDTGHQVMKWTVIPKRNTQEEPENCPQLRAFREFASHSTGQGAQVEPGTPP